MDERAWTVVPPFDPPGVEAWVVNSIAEAMLQEPHRRAYLWANWLLKEAKANNHSLVTSAVKNATSSNIATSNNMEFTDVADVTAGFIPVSPQTRREEHLTRIARGERRTHFLDRNGFYWTFGLVIGVRPRTPNQLLMEPAQMISPPDHDGFPVICEWRKDFDDDSKATAFHAPAHPNQGATSTCYVRPALGKRYYGRQWSEGILIARHVLGNNATAGAQVLMQSGTNLQVVEIDSATTIDAAILDAGPGAIPAGTGPLGLHPALSPGMSVNVSGAQMKFSASILRVMDDPKYFGNLMAHRAVLDSIGFFGDSGAAVTEELTGKSVGIYIGSIPGPPAEGLVQLMRQVTTYFQVELYC